MAIDAVRDLLKGGGDQEDSFYDEIVTIPPVGKQTSQKFIKMVADGDVYQIFPQQDIDFTFSFRTLREESHLSQPDV